MRLSVHLGSALLTASLLAGCAGLSEIETGDTVRLGPERPVYHTLKRVALEPVGETYDVAEGETLYGEVAVPVQAAVALTEPFSPPGQPELSFPAGTLFLSYDRNDVQFHCTPVHDDYGADTPERAHLRGQYCLFDADADGFADHMAFLPQPRFRVAGELRRRQRLGLNANTAFLATPRNTDPRVRAEIVRPAGLLKAVPPLALRPTHAVNTEAAAVMRRQRIRVTEIGREHVVLRFDGAEAYDRQERFNQPPNLPHLRATAEDRIRIHDQGRPINLRIAGALLRLQVLPDRAYVRATVALPFERWAELDANTGRLVAWRPNPEEPEIELAETAQVLAQQ